MTDDIKFEVLREKWEITARSPDGSILNSKSLGYVWVPFGHPYQVDNHLYSVVGTKKARELHAEGKNAIRQVRRT